MKIYVLGKNGMLGRYVYTYFKQKNYNVIGWSRDDLNVYNMNEYDLTEKLNNDGAVAGDVIINCIGVIKPMIDKYGTVNAIRINSLFPHQLSNVCENYGYNMIHITTDCVFSGDGSLYNEDSLHDATDVYGKTKSLGEPNNCTVIRTSIIGEELGQKRSLVEWVKSMKNKEVNGFVNHFWNGITCLEAAKVFEKIILNNEYWLGVRHITSPDIVNKFELLTLISSIYKLNIKINPIHAPKIVDRTLTSKHKLKLNIPLLEYQIQEMLNFKLV